MNTRLILFLLLFFASLTSTRTSAQGVDSIEVKGKAINGPRNVNTGNITVSRSNSYSIHLCTDTAGNFNFKIPAYRNDTSKVTVHVHCVEQLYWTAEGTQTYTIDELSKGITIFTSKLWGPIPQCGTHTSYYFDPPGKMTFFFH